MAHALELVRLGVDLVHHPERVLRMAQVSMSIALFGYATATAILAATDLVRLVRR